MTAATAPGPRVSVVVPVRDRRSLLPGLLAALDAQTFADFEVIVADDGSTDGSGSVAAAATCHGRPVRVVRVPGLGAVAARRAGVQASVGEILAFTDSDCLPEPGWLAAAVAAVDHGTDLVAGPTLPERPPEPGERTVWVDHDDGLYPTCNVVYRRDAFERAGGFDGGVAARFGFRHGRSLKGLGFGEDTVLAWRVRRSGKVEFVAEAVVRHRVFPADRGDAWRRAWAAGGFCALVREVPELRANMPGRVVLYRPTRLPLYAAAIALFARRYPAAAGLTALWVAAAGRTGPDALVADAITAAALVTGSIRSRSLVL